MNTVEVGVFGALGPHAPSFRVRTRIPAEEMARRGVRMRHYPLLDEREDQLLHRGSQSRRLQAVLQARRRLRRRLAELDGRFDVALIQRQVDLLPGLGLERHAVGDRRLVLDVDDAIWLDATREAGGHRLAVLKGTGRKLRWLAARADVVVAGNELLAEWLGRHSQRVVVVPSLVEHRSVPVRTHAEAQRVVLGWIGSPSTAPSLRKLRKPLEELACRMRGLDVELRVVGGDAPAVAGVAVRPEPWSEQSEQDFLESVDVGLMPLPDNAWTRGKCAYKALQYMASGIPVVADDVGVSAEVIGHEQGGLIARDPSSWVEYLGELAGDAGLRARLGGRGRERVGAGYSVEAWAPTLASILRGSD